MSVVVARSAVMLVLFVASLVVTVRVYRRTTGADMILFLLMAWFVHGIAYYVAGLFLFLTMDPYPRDVALAVNWWSTVLRFQVMFALLAVLIWHPGRRDG